MNTFKITPKKERRVNGILLTPEMTVTIKVPSSTPFYNGAKELKDALMKQYGFDYEKANCSANDFIIKNVSEE